MQTLVALTLAYFFLLPLAAGAYSLATGSLVRLAAERR